MIDKCLQCGRLSIIATSRCLKCEETNRGNKQQLEEKKLNRVYSERNYAAILAVKMALKLGLKAGWGIDDNNDWDIEWRHVIYIDLPNGAQLSWHMAPSEIHLLSSLPKYKETWDGTWLSRSSNFLTNI